MSLEGAVRRLQLMVHPDRWAGAPAALNAEAFKVLGGAVRDTARACDAGMARSFVRADVRLAMHLACGRVECTLPTDGRASDCGGVDAADAQRSLVAVLRRAGVWPAERAERARAAPEAPERVDWHAAGRMLDGLGVRLWRGLSAAEVRAALRSLYAARYVLVPQGGRPPVVVGGPPQRGAVVLPVHFSPADAVSACDFNPCVA